jgi:hypothetical protein
VGGVVVWLAGHAHLSCLNLRQWITIGVDIHSFIHSFIQQNTVCIHDLATLQRRRMPSIGLSLVAYIC